MSEPAGAKRTNPAFWVPTLYFAEGLPFAVVSVVATILYQRRGLSNEEIAFYTGLLLTPWSLKPFWSPLLEMFKTKKFWVITMQLVSGVGLGLIALTLPLPGYFGYSLALFAIVAFCSSTHDIAADGLYLSSLSPKEISAWAGAQGACWNAGKVFATGALVYLAGKLETKLGIVSAWVGVFFAIGGLMVALGLYHSRMLPAGGDERSVKTLIKPSSRQPLALYLALLALLGVLTWGSSRVQASQGVLVAWAFMCGSVVLFLFLAYRVALSMRGGAGRAEPEDSVETLSDVIVTFLMKPSIYVFMAFIFLYRAGEGQVNRIVPLFLLDQSANGGLALTPERVGVIYGTLGTIAFIVGSIAGGYFASKLGLKRAIVWLCLALNFPNMAYIYLASALPTNDVLISAAVIFEMFGYGFGFVGVIVLMMQEIAPGKYQMAHYAFATALMNVGLQLPGIVSGTVQQRLGYRNFFIWVLLCGIPGLIMSKFLPIRGGEPTPDASTPAEPATAS
jgi:MFS transporter, PAT family, beta-lactamase induction signal transducer AmpG